MSDFNPENYKYEQQFILNNPNTPTLKLMRKYAEHWLERQEEINNHTSYNKINELVSTVFHLGQRYQQDVYKGMSGELSEFYEPYLDSLINEAIK